MVYKEGLVQHFKKRSEVDPTGSLWYKVFKNTSLGELVLKLTLPGHYGISCLGGKDKYFKF